MSIPDIDASASRQECLQLADSESSSQERLMTVVTRSMVIRSLGRYRLRFSAGELRVCYMVSKARWRRCHQTGEERCRVEQQSCSHICTVNRSRFLPRLGVRCSHKTMIPHGLAFADSYTCGLIDEVILTIDVLRPNKKLIIRLVARL